MANPFDELRRLEELGEFSFEVTPAGPVIRATEKSEDTIREILKEVFTSPAGKITLLAATLYLAYKAGEAITAPPQEKTANKKSKKEN